MTQIEKLVIVTKQTALAELIERLNSREQARFYLEQNGVAFAEYEHADHAYRQALARLGAQLPRGVKQQFVDRTQLPTFQFGERDLVITLGPDGLVINVAKYLSTQPILALNPDPARINGTLIPFAVAEAGTQLARFGRGSTRVAHVSMAQVLLNDGQTLHAVNDLFIGTRGHGSARYQLALGKHTEQQSSSGIIISTGAGCTGWLRAIVSGAWAVTQHFAALDAVPPSDDQLVLGWDSDRLWFTVREPFVSKTSAATLVFGQIASGQELIITSQMPRDGVIFSDGIETDYLNFNAGAIARIRLAERKAHLLARA